MNSMNSHYKCRCPIILWGFRSNCQSYSREFDYGGKARQISRGWTLDLQIRKIIWVSKYQKGCGKDGEGF